MLPNTAPIDVTGHPSMSVPCGMSDGLPAGMMLTGKHFDEVSIYRAASAFEKSLDWKKVTPSCPHQAKADFAICDTGSPTASGRAPLGRMTQLCNN